MRSILLGPFGSMGSMNVKMRAVCIEDLMLQVTDVVYPHALHSAYD